MSAGRPVASSHSQAAETATRHQNSTSGSAASPWFASTTNRPESTRPDQPPPTQASAILLGTRSGHACQHQQGVEPRAIRSQDVGVQPVSHHQGPAAAHATNRLVEERVLWLAGHFGGYLGEARQHLDEDPMPGGNAEIGRDRAVGVASDPGKAFPHPYGGSHDLFP